MIPDSTAKALSRIANKAIGREHVLSITVQPEDDFQGGEALNIHVTLRPEAPDVSGKTYLDILIEARDYLAAHDDNRRPTISLERDSVRPQRVMKTSAR